MLFMPEQSNHTEQHAKPMPRKVIVALLLGAGLLLGWIFTGYFSPQILIEFVMRYCA
jgi:hypothetical protein